MTDKTMLEVLAEDPETAGITDLHAGDVDFDALTMEEKYKLREDLKKWLG